MVIEKGDKVKVNYVGYLEDGSVFDSSKEDEPLEFVVGENKIIKGFEEAVVGMEKGEEKEIILKPNEAYGDVNPELVKKIPKENFKSDVEPKEGMMLTLTAPNGIRLPARIVEVGENDLTIDLNHPLAGKTLKFKIKVLEVEKNKKE